MNGTLLPNTILQNRYQIARLLGAGGMGAVYQAWDLRLQGRVVAVKENFDVSPEARVQFQTEAGLLANLDHSTLPRVTDHFVEPNGRQYLVMDYIEGNDLEEMVTRSGRIPEGRAIALITEVLNGLDYLHSYHPPIIHRDIKPANIKIRSDGKAFLVDFGIAKAFDPSQRTRTGARAVTPGYSPIEQYGYGITDARSDIYSVGATLYFMLTAQVPPEATDLASNLQLLTPPSHFGIPISPPVEQAILRAMSVTPQQRFQSAREFREALNSPAATRPAVPLPAGAVRPTVNAAPNVAYPPMPLPGNLAPPRPQAPGIPSASSAPYFEYASWGQRLAAYLIDGVLLYIVGFCVGLPFTVIAGATSYSGSSSTTISVWSCLSMLAAFAANGLYTVGFLASSGQTPGKKVMRIRVVRTNGNKLSRNQATVRFLGYLISALMLYLGYLWPLWDIQKQAIHDKIAGTIVIRA